MAKLKKYILLLAFLFGVAFIVLAWLKLGTAKTALISAVSATICAAGGAVIGSSIGIATAGIGISAAVPLAIAGASACSWAGPVLAVFGIGRPPVWVLPLFIFGCCIVSSVLSIAVYRWARVRVLVRQIMSK